MSEHTEVLTLNRVEIDTTVVGLVDKSITISPAIEAIIIENVDDADVYFDTQTPTTSTPGSPVLAAVAAGKLGGSVRIPMTLLTANKLRFVCASGDTEINVIQLGG